MLVLTRKPGQQIMVGDDILINVVEVQGDNVRIAIDAPKKVKIYRGEIYKAIISENKAAATEVSQTDLSKLLLIGTQKNTKD